MDVPLTSLLPNISRHSQAKIRPILPSEAVSTPSVLGVFLLLLKDANTWHTDAQSGVSNTSLTALKRCSLAATLASRATIQEVGVPFSPKSFYPV